MRKRLIPAFFLAAYGALLIKVMVFKDIPTIRVGQLMLNFAGTDAGHGPNLVPFATILPYLFGHKGLIIAGINLVGNIALLVPVGFLIPFVYRNATWRKSLALAALAGLAIELLQTALRVGIFDIDDVILNAFGVMIGYWTSVILAQWMRSRNYKNIAIAAFVLSAAAAATLYAVYPKDLPANPRAGATGDICGGTGGTGQIVSRENHSITIERKDGTKQLVAFTDQTAIEVPAGSGSASDLRMGDRVTLVGGPNPDGRFAADAIVVCSTEGSSAQRR